MSARLSFYLVIGPPSIEFITAMVMLPVKMGYPLPTTYCLLAAMTTDAQHANLIIADPQPAAWHGSVAEARQLLRENDLTHLWWLYDWFIAAQGADRVSSFRGL